MKGIKRILLLALAVVIGIFIFQNQSFLGESGHIRFFKWDVTLIVGFWMVLSFLCGAVLFLILDLPGAIAMKLELRRKNQEIKNLQTELASLKAPGVGSDSSSQANSKGSSRP